MPDRIPLSRVRERGRGEGEQRYTSGTTPTDFRYTGQRSKITLSCTGWALGGMTVI
jgi:hypothetical protein